MSNKGGIRNESKTVETVTRLQCRVEAISVPRSSTYNNATSWCQSALALTFRRFHLVVIFDTLHSIVYNHVE